MNDNAPYYHVFDVDAATLMQKDDDHYDLWMLMDIPIFSLPTKDCKANKRDGVCGEVDDYFDFPEWKDDTTPAVNTQQIAQQLFTHVNWIRDDPDDWADTFSNI